jgi:hypothetical protein
MLGDGGFNLTILHFFGNIGNISAFVNQMPDFFTGFAVASLYVWTQYLA